MRKVLSLVVLFFVITSCQQEEINDPIVGTWKLISRSVDGVPLEMNECLLKSTVVFDIYNTVFFDKYDMNENTGDCELVTYTEEWQIFEGVYSIHNGSLFDQQATIAIENSQLIHSFQGWEFVGSQLITSDVVVVYEKQ
jgi:hypothetical protein